MLILPWIFKLNNYISKNFYRPPPLVGVYWLLLIILGSYYFTTQEVFMDYLSVFIEMLQAKILPPIPFAAIRLISNLISLICWNEISPRSTPPGKWFVIS